MNEEKKTFYDRCVEKAADVVVWATSHKKQIGVAIFGVLCYKIGYRKAEEKCLIDIVNSTIDHMIEIGERDG